MKSADGLCKYCGFAHGDLCESWNHPDRNQSDKDFTKSDAYKLCKSHGREALPKYWHVDKSKGKLGPDVRPPDDPRWLASGGGDKGEKRKHESSPSNKSGQGGSSGGGGSSAKRHNNNRGNDYFDFQNDLLNVVDVVQTDDDHDRRQLHDKSLQSLCACTVDNDRGLSNHCCICQPCAVYRGGELTLPGEGNSVANRDLVF